MRASLPAVLVLLVTGAPAVRAGVPDLPLTIYGNESAAATDGAAGFLFNPAAGGMRYPSELLLSWGRIEAGGLDAGGTSPASDARLLRGAFALRNAGVAVSGMEDGPSAFTFGVAGGAPVRWGASITSLRGPGGSPRATDLKLGVLDRPTPWLSFGAVVDHLAQPSMGATLLRREYTVAVGIRPLALTRPSAHTWGPRITLTADVLMREGAPNATARVRVGGEIELVRGIAVRGAIEDHGTYQLGVAFLGHRAAYHGQTAYARDGDLRYQSHAISLHEGEDASVLSGRRARRVAVVRVAGRLSDETLSGIGLLDSGGGSPTWWLHRQLERALHDPLTRGVLLDLRGVRGMAQVEELRPRIRHLREAGKPVVAYIEYGTGRAGLMLASACERIVTTPDAFYLSLGLRVEQRYYRGLLEKWGLALERSSYGEYKSAYRNFSVDSTTAADREVIDRVLDVNQTLFVETVTDDRGLQAERLRPVLDGRQWSAEELQKAGLVDSLGDREDAMRVLGNMCGLGTSPREASYARLRPVRREWRVPSRIAVVYATGAIETGRSGNDLFFGPYMGSETLIARLKAAFEHPEVEAVVLRVESPGGATLASDLIHHAVRRLKEKSGKPLIVSMGSVAASGGYHIASPADRIYANRFTYTGSIGVYFVKPSFEGLYANWGVRQDDFDRGAFMRGLSPNRDWNERLQAAADSATMRHYRNFVSDVATDRGRPYDDVERVARGRTWMGDDALEHGLIDRIGTLEDAIADARRTAGIPEGEKIRIVEYRRPRPPFFERYVRSLVGEFWRANTHLPEPGATYEWADIPYPE